MYQMIVTRLTNVRKHPNADRLMLATVVGNQVVIGLDHQEGELGVYFPTDGQLSEQMCYENDLNVNPQLNKNGGKGYFDEKRRVRSQKFRQEKSDGLWLPLECLKWFYPYGEFTEGQLISDEAIAIKYITKATRMAGQHNKVRNVKRGESLMFPKHYDTDNFQYYYQDIPAGSIIYLTEKLHGTSGRYGLVKDDGPPSQGRILDWLFGWWNKFRPTPWTYLNGTRNVVLEHTAGGGYYGTNDFRTEAVKNISLRKGEVIFFELVGDVSVGTPIMPPVIVPKELDDTRKKYGTHIAYRYGCANGEAKLFVYRIVQFNEDGQGVDLSWPQVKRRCKELGLDIVPNLRDTIMVWTDVDVKHNKEEIERLAEGPSLLDASHIREGVAIRVETPDGRIYCLKEKSFAFKVLEGIVKLDDEYVDTEEAS